MAFCSFFRASSSREGAAAERPLRVVGAGLSVTTGVVAGEATAV